VPLTVFAGGQVGQWRVEGIEPVTGPALPAVSRLAISDGTDLGDSGAAWALRGLTSNARYTRRDEQAALAARQAGLGRPEATRAALIPITKSQAWWALAQDERRKLFEETSHHIAIGLEYLPAIARRLYHGHDLDEPFDFLTWFEYAPQDAPAFEDLVARLRATPEWDYVDREVDIRLAR
jgi:chlorite dismutase